MSILKKTVPPVLSAAFGATLVYFLKDPFLAMIICIPVILLAQLLYHKINKK